MGRQWKSFFAFSCAMFLNTSGYAQSFDALGDHKKLNGQVVLDAGDVAEFSTRPNTGFDTGFDALRPRKETFYSIGNYCFVFSDFRTVGVPDIIRTAALLVANQTKNTSLVQFEKSSYSIKVTIRPVTLYDCGSIRKSELDDLKRQTDIQTKGTKDAQREMQLQLEELKANLERLQRQRP